jgi:hypothetical protein
MADRGLRAGGKTRFQDVRADHHFGMAVSGP